MIDRRENDDRTVCEIDGRLADLSDTAILEAFRTGINALLPHLAVTQSHLGDAWDDLSEDLYYSQVHLAFASKYGVPVPAGWIHKYGFVKHCYRRCFHVECRPTSLPLEVMAGGSRKDLTENELRGRILVFRAFVDDQGIDPSCSESRGPSMLTRAAICVADEKTGYRLREYDYNDISVAVGAVEFEWVAETYDPKEHEHYRDIYFEDSANGST